MSNKCIYRKKFTSAEDTQLLKLVGIHGKKWGKVAQHMTRFNARQCRDRYLLYLDPNINREPFTEEEDRLLLRNARTYAYHWYPLARLFDRRTPVQLKYRYYKIHNKQMRDKRRKENEERLAQTKIKLEKQEEETKDETQDVTGLVGLEEFLTFDRFDPTNPFSYFSLYDDFDNINENDNRSDEDF